MKHFSRDMKYKREREQMKERNIIKLNESKQKKGRKFERRKNVRMKTNYICTKWNEREQQ